ncbi:MAG TPA: LytTR family DNA-binding domain-containing protein [Puia sp.]|jgi:DNA-binding LytR/AlgR family response regulator|nr:LytTR family DNA-binding domain-containing protein [Puia sp.]
MSTNKIITCLAVDDEPPALDVVTRYISAIPHLHLAGACSNAVQALAMLQQQSIDLLFLDIQMPRILGTQFLRTLKNPPKVIFTTAYRKFAVEGFELDAVDYLLKPITFQRFLKAVNKVMDLPGQDTPPTPSPAKNNSPEFIHIRADRKMQKVAIDDIIYIESLRDYSKIVTRSKKIITRQPISSIENNLPADSFIRIHRSYLVSIRKIESYTNEFVEIAQQELPIGRMYRLSLLSALS